MTALQSDPEPLINPRKPMELARECPLDIYLSGCDGGGEGATYFPWAYRMNKTLPDGNCEASPSYRDTCDAFILDSSISDENITTDDVIETTRAIEPEYVIPADVEHDQDRTTEHVHEFLEWLSGADLDTTPVIPLQPAGTPRQGRATDHATHYQDLAGLSTHYAIGGLKDATSQTQRAAAEAVRSVAGDDVTLHGLGFGMAYLNSHQVAERPVLDSIDCSTPIQEARQGRSYVFRDGRLRQLEQPKPTDEFALLQIAMASGTTLIALARQVLNTDASGVNHQLNSFGGAQNAPSSEALTDGGTPE